MKQKQPKRLLLALSGCFVLFSSGGTLRVTAAEPPGTEDITYDSEKTESVESATVNYHRGPTFSVTIPKNIALSEDKTASYDLTVSGDIASDEEVWIVPEDMVPGTDETDFYIEDISGGTVPKPDVLASIVQEKTAWTFEEADAAVTSEGNTITAEALTAGEWKGTVNFDILLHTHDYSSGDCACGAKSSRSDIVAKKDSFSDYTWSEIGQVCEQGLANDYFTIGDTRQASIGALASSAKNVGSQTMDLLILDIAEDGKSMTVLTTNYSGYPPVYAWNSAGRDSAGSWADSEARSALNGDFYSALEQGLQNLVVSHETVYSTGLDAEAYNTCSDKVWLLSEKEITGTATLEPAVTADAETQLAYFVQGNVMPVSTTLRSLVSTAANYTGYAISNDSNYASWSRPAWVTFSICPAFVIGAQE